MKKVNLKILAAGACIVLSLVSLVCFGRYKAGLFFGFAFMAGLCVCLGLYRADATNRLMYELELDLEEVEDDPTFDMQAAYKQIRKTAKRERRMQNVLYICAALLGGAAVLVLI